jgi:hypothetical protein
MNSPEFLRSELTNYLILAAELKAQFADIDQETLTDTLEGASGLPEAIAAVVRSSLNDAALIEALKGRLEDLDLRLGRFKDRYEKKRALARWAMQEAGLDKVMAEDFSVGLRKGLEKLDVSDEGKIPAQYFVPQPVKLDRKAVLDALKTGNAVTGANLVMGETSIQVRVR